MIRKLVLVGLALAAGAAVAVPALADDAEVVASGFSFSPRTIKVAPGGTVHWTNGGGGHNVKFVGEAAMPAQPSAETEFNGANVSKTFTEPGTYKYYCVAHAANENDTSGMTGTVIVENAVPPTDPTPTPSPGPTETPTPEPVALPFNATVRNSPACVAKGCPGIRIKVRSSQRVAVDGLLKRGRKPVANIHFKTTDGKKTIVLKKVAGTVLKPGDYTLTLTSDGYPGKVRLKFSVAPSD